MVVIQSRDYGFRRVEENYLRRFGTTISRFKESFDVESGRERLGLIKDVVTMVNSGGGTIVIGLSACGESSGFDVDSVLATEPADVTNKIFAYTGYHFSKFRIFPLHKGTAQIAVIEMDSAAIPIVFSKVGNYQRQNEKSKNAFALGSVYFRYGAKSEPFRSEDWRQFLQRELERIKES